MSGISSGAALAVQLQVAYSSVFKGAGVIAGCNLNKLIKLVKNLKN